MPDNPTTKHARIRSLEEYHEAYRRSVENPEQFWAEVAEPFTWRRKWSKVLDSDLAAGRSEWFQGARLNITENCLDRHLATRANKLAII